MDKLSKLRSWKDNLEFEQTVCKACLYYKENIDAQLVRGFFIWQRVDAPELKDAAEYLRCLASKGMLSQSGENELGWAVWSTV
jgi:hypothetical protein